MHLDGAPDVVRIRFTEKTSCSGVYIDATTILTAAHCVTPTKTWMDPVVIEAIESVNRTELDVKVLKLIPQPRFAEQYWPAFDVALIKTTENKKFEGAFKMADETPLFGSATFFGTGRIQAHVDYFERTTGTNFYVRIGSVLSFLGHAKKAMEPTGSWVGIAHGDSGGMIVSTETGQIIAVITTSTINQSSGLWLPTYGTGTSVTSDENRKFILSHLDR